MTAQSIRVAPSLGLSWAGAAGAAGVEEMVVGPDPWKALPLLLDVLPAVVFAVLVLRRRRGLLAAQVPWHDRLLLALLGGWMSAVIYRLTGDWLFGLPSYGGVVAIGAVFGLLVLAPVLPGAARYPIRVVLLVATAALAHYTAWRTAGSLFGLIDEWSGPRGEIVIIVGGLGGPALVVFALLTAVAAWRVAALQPTGTFWLVLLGGGWLSGWLYQVAVLDAWGAGLVMPGRASDYVIYPVFMLWYALSATTFGLARRQAPERLRAPDLALLAGLLLGWAWMLWSMPAGAI